MFITNMSVFDLYFIQLINEPFFPYTLHSELTPEVLFHMTAELKNIDKSQTLQIYEISILTLLLSLLL